MAANIKLPKRVVIDASVGLAFLLPDERSSKIDSVFKSLVKKKIALYVPAIFYFEVFNGLRGAVLRRRISRQTAMKLLCNFLKLPLQKKEIEWSKTLQIALKEKLSFYDAAYLALAQKEKILLFTFDKTLGQKTNVKRL